MKNIKIEHLKTALDEKWKFLNEDKDRSAIEILDWVSDVVALLTKMNVNSEIIAGFMKLFELEVVDVEAKKNDSYNFHSPYDPIAYRILGPFVSEMNEVASSPYHFKDNARLSYIKIAFKTAHTILEEEIEEERIVPKWLINELENNGNHKNIISSLELIQTKYENKDPIDLVKNVITLLENILDLEPSLKNSKKKIDGKLNTLLDQNNNKLLDKFGADSDMIRALLNGKVIRNLHTHKDKKISYDTPFLIACSFAYLVVIFLEITISTGELIQ